MRDQTEDLKAFEQRLTECVSHMESKSKKWRILLVIAVIFILLSLLNTWRDTTTYSTFKELLLAHKELAVSFGFGIVLCMSGGVQRSRSAKVVTHRCRNVLHNYNMSCDEQGKLILKRPQR